MGMAVACRQMDCIRKLVIDFDVELQSFVVEIGVGPEVVGTVRPARLVGKRIEIENILADLVPKILRNFVARESSPIAAAIEAERVEDQIRNNIASIGIGDKRLGEVALALIDSGNCPDNVDWISLDNALHVDEKERVVLAYGTAQRKAVLVARMWRLRQSRLIAEEVVGIQRIALSKPPTAAMEAVGAALQCHVYDGAAVAAKFCRESVVLNLKLLHRFHRRLIEHVGVAALALFRGTDKGSIHT